MNILKYINSDGFVTDKSNAETIPGEGNGWLQTGLAMATFPKEYLAVVGKDKLVSMLADCRKSYECPLIYRSPHKKNADDTNAADDYWGALLIFKLIKYPSWANELYVWAKARNWHFDIQQPDSPRIEYNFNRFVHFIPFLRQTIGEPLSLIESIGMAVGIVFDSFSIDEPDPNKKVFCKISLMEIDSIVCRLAGLFWRWRVRRKYGHIGACWAASLEPGHFLSAYDLETK